MQNGVRLFTTAFLLDTLLNADNLRTLNDQAKWALYAFAETGAGLSELTGLWPEHIHLDAEIPHIVITTGKMKSLKMKCRKREIPLVGFALDAFKAVLMALQTIMIGRMVFLLP